MSSLLVKRVVRFSGRPRYRTIQIQADPHTVTTDQTRRTANAGWLAARFGRRNHSKTGWR
jgi:hypothetical protein